jgi:DNA helicase-2/ATP-dependent DNA helicase PcrA
MALAQTMGARAGEGADRLRALVEDLHARGSELAPASLLDLVLERSGYRDWLVSQRDGPERLAHLAALRDLAGRATDLAELLRELHLDDDGSQDDAERVVLSTIHGAKGGEWRVVFVIGLEEGLLPHHRALSASADPEASVEDERRVAYVAVTRPRERLYLTRCANRRLGARLEPRRPSRFLRGLPLVERAA